MRRFAGPGLLPRQRGNVLADALAGVSDVERVIARAGTVLVEPKVDWRYYWLVLDGEIIAERPESDGSYTLAGNFAGRRRFW